MAANFKNGVLITGLITAWFALAGPLWYFTMATYRAPLNYGQMTTYDQHIDTIMSTLVPIYLNSSSENLPDIVAATQLIADRELASRGVTNWGLRFYQGESSGAVTVNLEQTDTNYYFLSETGRAMGVSYDLELLTAGQLPEVISGLIIDNIFKQEIEWFSGKTELPGHVLKYSPNYHITFSLIHGDGEKLTWQLDEGLAKFHGLRRALAAGVANTTVDTQIEYFARTGARPKFDEDSKKWQLSRNDLATFVNFAEWSLASSFSYPTINFVIYVPPRAQTPLIIEGSESSSFLVPQWGGVYIYNDLDDARHLDQDKIYQIMDLFASQLLSLLGTPSEPVSPHLRLDSLSRISAARAIRATASSLGSLTRLANNMPNIAIPREVYDNCEAALKSLSDGLFASSAGAYSAAIHYSGRALGYAEAAFFDKHIVSQAFFPDEHKLAVYMPLLGPICVLLFSSWLRIRLRSKYGPEQQKLLDEAEREGEAAVKSSKSS